jgi:altronate dehydratase
VIKITGNPGTYQHLSEHIDVFVDLGLEAGFRPRQAGEAIFDKVLAVASGTPTKAEIAKYGNFPNIFSIGPVL